MRFIILLWLMGIVSVISAAETRDTSPLTLDDWQVIDVIETNFIARPNRSGAYLAPNGEIFAHLELNSTLCIYHTTTLEQQRCFDLREDFLLRVDFNSIVWSPDSRYITAHNNFFQLLLQPDIHIFDVETGDVTIIDPDEPFTMDDEDWGRLDVVPRWLADGRLAFLRYDTRERSAGSMSAPDLMVYDLNAQTVASIGRLIIGEGNPYAIYKFDISADGQTLIHNFYSGGSNVRNGVWLSEINPVNGLRPPRQIVHNNLIQMLEFSPDDSQIMVNSEDRGAFVLYPEPSPDQTSTFTTADLQLLHPEYHIMGAGWSPDGSLLAYIVRDTANGEADGLYITDQIGVAGRQVLAGDFRPALPFTDQSLIWSANNRLLIAHSADHTVMIVQLGNSE